LSNCIRSILPATDRSEFVIVATSVAPVFWPRLCVPLATEPRGIVVHLGSVTADAYSFRTLLGGLAMLLIEASRESLLIRL
jgi:hypothetical protein